MEIGGNDGKHFSLLTWCVEICLHDSMRAVKPGINGNEKIGKPSTATG